ncbi:hypothetical protein GGR53DRAFT_512800 [Hypoxylon sp. FL1150]|nr:hypothetical protein GGR53DRAFT_512800 [Hypoxylon sp. FL1150]
MFARTLGTMFRQAVAEGRRYYDDQGREAHPPQPAPLRVPQPEAHYRPPRVDNVEDQGEPQRRPEPAPEPQPQPVPEHVIWPPPPPQRVPEPRYAPIERLPPIRRQFPEPPAPEPRPQPQPQPVPQHVVWPPPQPAPQPPPVQNVVRRPLNELGHAHAPAHIEYPQEQWLWVNGARVLIWPPVDREAGPRGPPPREWSRTMLVYCFLTRWLWLLIYGYTAVLVRLLVVSPVFYVVDKAPAIVAAVRWAIDAPWIDLWDVVRSFRVAAVLSFVCDGGRRVAVALYRSAVSDARAAASILLALCAFLVPVVSWLLWLNFMFCWQRPQDSAWSEDPTGWGEELAVDYYFRDANLWSKPRWRHTVDGHMVRLADWSSF